MKKGISNPFEKESVSTVKIGQIRNFLKERGIFRPTESNLNMLSDFFELNGSEEKEIKIIYGFNK